EALRKDRAQLRAVLSYHVVAGRLTSADIGNGKLKNLQGGEIATSTAGDFVTVEDALVTRANLPASNGVVHVIDRVLLPPKK
ncbi:fasciclin domain-containing protein, partial [Klebsiella pneumoniae]|uniref:fasciclin domain-containing protein n=1 Tax=Klebsiella pneumoniae TaxID=573 RepID=UPI003D0590F1